MLTSLFNDAVPTAKVILRRMTNGKMVLDSEFVRVSKEADKVFRHRVQTGSGAYPASYPMVTWGKAAGA